MVCVCVCMCVYVCVCVCVCAHGQAPPRGESRKHTCNALHLWLSWPAVANIVRSSPDFGGSYSLALGLRPKVRFHLYALENGNNLETKEEEHFDCWHMECANTR